MDYRPLGISRGDSRLLQVIVRDVQSTIASKHGLSMQPIMSHRDGCIILCQCLFIQFWLLSTNVFIKVFTQFLVRVYYIYSKSQICSCVGALIIIFNMRKESLSAEMIPYYSVIKATEIYC